MKALTYILKGLWLKHQANKYAKLVEGCTEARAKLREKQAKYSHKCSEYEARYKAH